MQLKVVQRILGLLLVLFSVTMLPPFLVGFWYGELQDARSFALTYFITFVTGALMWLPVRKQKRDLKLRDGFIVVVLFWTVLSLFGAIPFWLSPSLDLSIEDCIFESVSGLTTTGATVLFDLDTLPHAVLFYRQQLQWLGGMGIVVLAVAILPMLGIGGMQLYRAETPGPMKDSKLTPRITETAKALWYIYLWLTILCGIAYWLAGMAPFDAICHSFSTIAIGGFSTHDTSLGYYDSPLVELVAVVFMILAGANFALHFMAWKKRSFYQYLKDAEFLTYISILTAAFILTTVILSLQGVHEGLDESLVKSLFQVISIGTTTGFVTDDFSHWPHMVPVMLIMLSFIGGCAGSTGGGMKVIRVLLLFKQGGRELWRLIHPNAEFTVKLGGRPVESRVLQAVWGFLSAYILMFVIMLLMLMATGMDQVSAYSAVIATLNNLGPGLGEVETNYANVSITGKWILCVGMLLGRLEIFTLLVIFTPMFWRK